MYLCSKETIKRYKEYLDPLDLTYTQYLAMLVLWNGDNISVNDLSKRLYLDSGTVTPLLKKLEVKGLIERYRDPADDRVVLITVAEKGFELKDKVKKIPEKILAETGIPPSEASEILTTLKSVLERTSIVKLNFKE